jgi:hypothetical protein
MSSTAVIESEKLGDMSEGQLNPVLFILKHPELRDTVQ